MKEPRCCDIDLKKYLHHAMIAVFTVIALHAMAVDEPHDTVYFFDSWERIMADQPEAIFVDPYISIIPPYYYDWYFSMSDRRMNRLIRDRFVAASLEDKWLISRKYLVKNFGWHSGEPGSYVPFYFNDKVAYVDYEHPVFDNLERNFYYIDFKDRKMRKVTASLLSELLEEWGYLDLKMRFEGSKDFKKPEIVGYYFFQFIDRATYDPAYPSILDIMRAEGTVDNSNELTR